LCFSCPRRPRGLGGDAPCRMRKTRHEGALRGEPFRLRADSAGRRGTLRAAGSRRRDRRGRPGRPSRRCTLRGTRARRSTPSKMSPPLCAGSLREAASRRQCSTRSPSGGGRGVGTCLPLPLAPYS
jgi:hypothetical protein